MLRLVSTAREVILAFLERDSEGKIMAILSDTNAEEKELLDPASKEMIEILYGDFFLRGGKNLQESPIAADLFLAGWSKI